MSLTTLQIQINGNLSRNDIRKAVLDEFLKETPGTGKGAFSSRYRYNVEQLANGNWIYLRRPAFNANGFDFAIHVENMRFPGSKIPTRPKHSHIFDDLKAKKISSLGMYQTLYNAISDVYNCTDPQNVLQSIGNLQFTAGYSVELILKIIKWYFIEQDIRYWNYSGRGMFMSGVNSI